MRNKIEQLKRGEQKKRKLNKRREKLIFLKLGFEIRSVEHKYLIVSTAREYFKTCQFSKLYYEKNGEKRRRRREKMRRENLTNEDRSSDMRGNRSETSKTKRKI